MSPVTVVGMVAGGLLLLTAIVVFITKKEFSTGGVAVTVVAMILIGMSQWSNIQFEAFGIKFAALTKAINMTAAAADEVAAQTEQAAAEIAATREQLASLTQQIANTHVLSPGATAGIQTQLSTPPKIDLEKLKKARTDLERIKKTP